MRCPYCSIVHCLTMKTGRSHVEVTPEMQGTLRCEEQKAQTALLTFAVFVVLN